MDSVVSPRTRPHSVKVHVSSGAGVDVAWEDGHESHYDFAYLRDQCPCAVCIDERQHPRGMAGTLALPLFKPRGARAASAVGNYAVQFDFSDGHSTGIFTYAYLREICPCAECRALAAAER